MEPQCQYDWSSSFHLINNRPGDTVGFTQGTASHSKDVGYCMLENNDKCVYILNSRINSKSSITLFRIIACNVADSFILFLYIYFYDQAPLKSFRNPGFSKGRFKQNFQILTVLTRGRV